MLDLKTIFNYYIVALSFFILGIVVETLREQTKINSYKKNYKAIVENFLALSVSHLHDAANLFNLLKNHSKEKDSIGFATSAAYHFRSIFQSLKNTLLRAKDFEIENLKNDAFYYFIEKEKINLKDLINLELFQIGNFSRIQIIDNIEKDYAFIDANFELLSKAVLNLVENALKYTDTNAKISLSEENEHYVLRIISYGQAISESLSQNINDKLYNKLQGHGLSSIIDIMNYHNADIHITSLASEGSCINLEFKKASFEREIIKTNSKPKVTSLKKIKYNPVLVACTALLLIVFVIYPSLNLSTQNQHQKQVLENTDLKDELDLEIQLDSLIDQETAALDLDMKL